MEASVNQREETIATLDELATLLRQCDKPLQAAWAEEQRDDPDLREVRRKLSGMGSLGDLWLEPPPEAGLSRTEAHARLEELVARLDRLTASTTEPSPPGRMLRVGESSKDLERG